MVYNKIMETGRTRNEQKTKHLKEVFIMKKSVKVLFLAYKVIYILCTIAVLATYISELLNPAAAYGVISGDDWFILGFMSCDYAFITEKEKNAEIQIAENN